MLKEIIATGKDVAEAKDNARAALGASELDDVNFEILHLGSRGILGIIGVKPAQVKASIEIPDQNEHKRGSANNKQEQKKSHEHSNKNNRKKAPKSKEDKPREKAPHKDVVPEANIKLVRREVACGEDMSYEFIKTLIGNIGLSAEAELYSCDDGTRRIMIVGDDASVLIGHHGDTLDALQYLANLASARKNINGERDKSRVTIDIGGYRAKREETLRALARRMAAKAIRNKRSVMLEPMSAYERRIIHSEVQGIEGVSTNSIGSDNNRKIVIYLTDKKPAEIFEDEDVSISLKEEFTADIDDLTASIGGIETHVTSDLSDEDAPYETVTLERSEELASEDADI